MQLAFIPKVFVATPKAAPAELAIIIIIIFKVRLRSDLN
jgi:hypothetical protein